MDDGDFSRLLHERSDERTAVYELSISATRPLPAGHFSGNYWTPEWLIGQKLEVL